MARRWLPRGITDRRKVGFDSPIGQWIKTELREFVESFLSREQIERSGLLCHDGVRQILDHHLAGKRDYSLQLWSLLALEAWHRMYIEDRVTDASDYTLGDLRGAIGDNGATATAVASARAVPLPEAKGRAGLPPWRTRRHLWQTASLPVRRRVGRILSVLPLSFVLGAKFRRTLRFVREAQWWSAEQAQHYQLDQVRRICSLAYERSPFYRRSFDEAGLHPSALASLDDLAKLPTIDRQTLNDHARDMCSVPWPPANADFVATGGTGGSPLQFYINADRSATEFAYLVGTWERAGYALGSSIAVLRGQVVPLRDDGIHHAHDPLLRHHYYSSFHMTEEQMARYVEHMCRLAPSFLHVYPSSADQLVRFIERSGCRSPKLRAVLAESEIVYPDQRRRAERILGCRYFSCYGHTEKLVLACECERSSRYHVWPTYGYFELLDEDARPVTTPGRRGEIVGTGFINTVVPFIRYRTGDFATYVASRCEDCGRDHSIIEDIRGHRTQEMLVMRDGSQVSWTALNMHDDTFDNVRQFQFYQDAPGQALLRIVPATGFSPEDESRIRANLDRKLDGRLRLDIQCVEAIPLSPRGKAIYIDQTIGPMDAARGDEGSSWKEYRGSRS